MRRLIFLVCVLCSIPSCAVFNRENTRALNFVEAKLVPKDPLAKNLTYPLTIPTSLAAVMFDMFLLHPLTVVPDSIDDLKELAWKNMDWKDHYFTTSASVIPRSAFTPLAFAGSFLVRSTFDVSHQPAPLKASDEELNRLVRDAQNALKEQRLDEALAFAQKALKKSPHQPDALEVRATVLLGKGEIRQLVAQSASIRWSDEMEKRYVQAIGKATPENRVRLLYMVERGMFHGVRPSNDFLGALISVLRDDDRAVRMKTLAVLGNYLSNPSVQAAFVKIKEEGDPVLAAEAELRLPK